MLRDRCGDANRILVLVKRHHDLTREQMQGRADETWRGAVDAVAEDRPAHRLAMHAKLVRAAGDGFERQPGVILPLKGDGKTRLYGLHPVASRRPCTAIGGGRSAP